MKYEVFIILCFFISLGLSASMNFKEQKNFVWLPYYYTPKSKNFDFNDYIKVFAYSGDKASVEYKIYYPNITDKCKFPGRKITYDLDVRIWLKNGSFNYYYIKKVCVNGSDHGTYVYCTDKNCYILETCFLSGYKNLCKNGDEDDLFIVYNKSLNIWKINKNGNLSLIYHTSGFKSAGDSIDLKCNLHNICWAKMAPNEGYGYYIFNFNEFDKNRIKIYNVTFDKDVDSIYFLNQSNYIYHTKEGIYDQYNNLLYKTKNKIKDCVIYSKDELYCLLQNVTNGFINSELVYFNLKNKKAQILKTFTKFGLFEKIVSKGIDKKNNEIFFICQTPGLKSVDFYIFIYNIKNNDYNYEKINSVGIGSFWEFYGKIKKYKIENGSLMYFGFSDKKPNGSISIILTKIPINKPYEIKVIDNFNRSIRKNLIDMFSYTIYFKTLSNKNKIPIKIYLNNNLVINKNVTNGEIVEFIKKFEKPTNITVKVCYRNNCTVFKYEIIQPKINQTENKTIIIKPTKNTTNNETVKPKEITNEKHNFNIIPLIIIILLIVIIIFIFLKKKKDNIKSDMM